MKTAYRHLQHWDHWLTQCLGKDLLATEQRFLAQWVAKHSGKHSLLLGVPEQIALLNVSASSYQYRWLLTPLFHHKEKNCSIEASFHEMPILPGSVDLMLLPHSLEFVDNPHHVLTEACRLVKPEGYIVIIGFNPYSLLGLKKYWGKAKSTPWTSHFIPRHQIQAWLALSDFMMIEQRMAFFRPPVSQPNLLQKLKFLEYVGSILYRAFGGIYILVAQAKITPLTPIRLHWKQELSNIPLSTTITGPSMRNPR